MYSKFLFVLFLLICLSAGQVFAQDETETTGENTINYLFIICSDQAILDVSGFMNTGFDIYFQIYSGTTQGSGVTNQQQISVDGNYQVSAVIPFTSGAQFATGESANMTLAIAPEANSSAATFVTTVVDTQDGCNTPSYTTVTPTDNGTSFTVSSTTSGETSAAPSQTTTNTTTTSASSSTSQASTNGATTIGVRIPTPFGDYLNASTIVDYTNEAAVVIGPRASSTDSFVRPIVGRTVSPGLVFAECDRFPGSEPGIIYDTDTIQVFWSWFASSPELVEQHLAFVEYRVYLDSQLLPFPHRTEIQELDDGNYWVFFIVNLGDSWRPGSYGIRFEIFWNATVTDGYEFFGFGTENPPYSTGCGFVVQPNPWGVEVVPQNPKIPLERY